jgi:hypothetical protein
MRTATSDPATEMTEPGTRRIRSGLIAALAA